MKKIALYLLVSTLMSFLFFVRSFPDTYLHIVTCDVGQGDAILIMQGFTQILIDGGPSDAVQSCLAKYMPWLDGQIEMVVLTHPEQDHMKGLLGVFSDYQVGLFVANNVANSSETFKKLQNLIWEKRIKTIVSSGREEYRAGKLVLYSRHPFEDYQVASGRVWPSSNDQNFSHNYNKKDHLSVLGAYDGDLNETSTVLELRYGEVSALFTGDITSRGEQALMRYRLINPVNILKIAHHGSKTSSSMAFLEQVRPEWALISVGRGNRYGHPAGEVLMRLDALKVRVFRTDELGDIELVSDGERIWSE